MSRMIPFPEFFDARAAGASVPLEAAADAGTGNGDDDTWKFALAGLAGVGAHNAAPAWLSWWLGLVLAACLLLYVAPNACR
jgi:hypothetical protein